MNTTLKNLLLAAGIALTALGCKQAVSGGVAVNPQDGTYYYRGGAMPRLKICDVKNTCTDGGGLVSDVRALEYVNGKLWLVDGKQIHTCSLEGVCNAILNTQINDPVGLTVDNAGSRVLVIGAAGSLVACDFNGQCERLQQ